MPETNIDELCIKTLRMLSIDMVEKAKSGHPGMPLGAAPMAYVLFSRFLKHDPENPKWVDRDRFILSAGHGCALLYSLLHLYGYGISMEDLKQFRQYGSITPGHPEYGLTPGVEATTGPLGQGFGMGVGMAIAEKVLGDCFNTPDLKIIDHYTYAIVSDGDLMEGISSEAASLAGTMKLGKIIYFYDENHVSIEGDTSITFCENVAERFEAYGWQTIEIADGNDIDSIAKAIEEARGEKQKPSLIIVRTHIGFGSPKQDTGAAHGEPLGEEGVKETKEKLGWPTDKSFFVPEEVYTHFKRSTSDAGEKVKTWHGLVEKYRKKNPEQAELLNKYLEGRVNSKLTENFLEFFQKDGPVSTRVASEKVMNNIEKYMTEFMGGSADLSPSTKTLLHGYGDIGVASGCARNMHFGVREHAMGAITNGIALHGGLIPYCATFLIFSDYMRPPLRLAALMKTHSIFIFTHDSIALGQDGPTHQPVEQLSSLRMIPGMTVVRPADANETSAAWNYAIANKRPMVLCLTRQNLPVLDFEKYKIFENLEKGAYILLDAGDRPDVILVATGSEVQLAMGAYEKLKAKNIKARVVSMPSYEIFMEQPEQYRQNVIPPDIKKRVIIEAGSPFFWKGVAGDEGCVIGVDKFGASAPGEIVMEKYGFTVENVVEKAMKVLNK
jgi:transketolase